MPNVDYWHIKEENNWLPQIEELRRLVKSNTKLICLNNAAQPTGAIMSPKFLSEVVKLHAVLMLIFFVMKFIFH